MSNTLGQYAKGIARLYDTLSHHVLGISIEVGNRWVTVVYLAAKEPNLTTVVDLGLVQYERRRTRCSCN